MKIPSRIPPGRQVQLALAVLILLPATLGYGPLSHWFTGLDLALRRLTTPAVTLTGVDRPLVVEVEPLPGAMRWPVPASVYAQIIERLEAAASVTVVDAMPPDDAELALAMRQHRRVYVTDLPAARLENSPVAAAAADVASLRFPRTATELYDGVPMWTLVDRDMHASAALAPLLGASDPPAAAADDLRDVEGRVWPTRQSAPDSVKAAALLSPAAGGQLAPIAGRAVFVGASPTFTTERFAVSPSGTLVTPAVAAATVHGALSSGAFLRRPPWTVTVAWIVLAAGLYLVVSWLWHESRPVIAATAAGTVAGLVAGQWLAAVAAGVQLDLGRPILALLFGFAGCAWLTPDAKTRRRATFRNGMRYLREGRLEASFRALRQCTPHPSLMPTLYKLALAFEAQGQPEQSKTVFAFMAGRKQSDPSQDFAEATARQYPQSIANLPSMLGRYEILRPLGGGAMGGVYLARDPRINRLIALKIVAFDAMEDEAQAVESRARFFQEAESAGRLTHPDITAIYDSGEEQGFAYLAMEYVPGVQMVDFTSARSRIEPHLLLGLMARVAEALHYAHSEHVVHRDIKPANLVYDRNQDIIKITDFGVARLVDSSRTQTGVILGTPSYMSPEQASGGEVTGLSDLFSLGVTLYELLTGGVPFRGNTIAGLMAAINNEKPQPVTEICPGLPMEINDLLDQALAKDPARRFASGQDMAFALRECASVMFAHSTDLVTRRQA
jgi:serine/threonine-protein kinase